MFRSIPNLATLTILLVMSVQFVGQDVVIRLIETVWIGFRVP